tara:strand:+ start:95 stop:496 length:402 start_codon:yes stop_codon:yes gene_type:complete
MAKKYAKINSLNEVVKVYVVDDNETQSSVEALFGDNDTHIYKETNDSIRERPASIGGTYDAVNDVFINAKPYPSWTLNASREWEAPVTQPTESQTGDRSLLWDEDNQKWVGTEIVDGGDPNQSDWNPSTSSWE